MKLISRLKVVSTLNYWVLSKKIAQLPYLLCQPTPSCASTKHMRFYNISPQQTFILFRSLV